MKKSLYTYAMLLAMPIVALMSSCEPRDLNENDVFTSEAQLSQILEAENPEGYKIYNLNDFLDTFMTEEGNFASDTCPYRTRSTNGNGLFLYAVDTLPTYGEGIYIRGRVTTDDYAGNFYKAIVIQQIVNGEQQNLRISVDMGSSGGMFQLGQEILIRCNGLAVGRYANQPQLCVPSYNNNIYAMNASQKVGWAPGRISSARFRNAVRMIGVPDQSKLQYDTLTLKQLYTEIPLRPSIDAAGMDKIRKIDGRLIVIKNVSFTGQANDDGSIVNCEYAHPDSSGLANVFAPTTNNIGYPQNRILKDYDIEIIEAHHNRKLDAPSGTALMIADAIKDEIKSTKDSDMNYVFDRSSVRKKREETDIGISAIRGGNIVGEHEVMFIGGEEIVKISHSAQTRDVFARGAIAAAKYLYNKEPGMYDMTDMISGN